MADCKYIVVKNEYIDGENTHVSYGIAAIDNCDRMDCVLETVSDISSDFCAIETLVNVCNAEELDPIHIEDVVNDFLAAL
jgi:hypothetical protein